METSYGCKTANSHSRRKVTNMSRQEAIDTALAKWPTARKIAVENATMGVTDGMAFRMNLEQDRRAYGWKPETMKAINFVMVNSNVAQ